MTRKSKREIEHVLGTLEERTSAPESDDSSLTSEQKEALRACFRWQRREHPNTPVPDVSTVVREALDHIDARHVDAIHELLQDAAERRRRGEPSV